MLKILESSIIYFCLTGLSICSCYAGTSIPKIYATKHNIAPEVNKLFSAFKYMLDPGDTPKLYVYAYAANKTPELFDDLAIYRKNYSKSLQSFKDEQKAQQHAKVILKRLHKPNKILDTPDN